MYIDSGGPDGPMDMETDGPLLDDVNALKKSMEEEATQVGTACVCVYSVVWQWILGCLDVVVQTFLFTFADKPL